MRESGPPPRPAMPVLSSNRLSWPHPMTVEGEETEMPLPKLIVSEAKSPVVNDWSPYLYKYLPHIIWCIMYTIIGLHVRSTNKARC